MRLTFKNIILQNNSHSTLAHVLPFYEAIVLNKITPFRNLAGIANLTESSS